MRRCSPDSCDLVLNFINTQLSIHCIQEFVTLESCSSTVHQGNDYPFLTCKIRYPSNREYRPYTLTAGTTIPKRKMKEKEKKKKKEKDRISDSFVKLNFPPWPRIAFSISQYICMIKISITVALELAQNQERTRLSQRFATRKLFWDTASPLPQNGYI